MQSREMNWNWTVRQLDRWVSNGEKGMANLKRMCCSDWWNSVRKAGCVVYGNVFLFKTK